MFIAVYNSNTERDQVDHLMKRMPISKTRNFGSKICFLATCLFLLSTTHTAHAADKIIALTEQYYPWNYTANGQNDGEILGYATELVTAVFEEANIEYEIHIVPCMPNDPDTVRMTLWLRSDWMTNRQACTLP